MLCDNFVAMPASFPNIFLISGLFLRMIEIDERPLTHSSLSVSRKHEINIKWRVLEAVGIIEDVLVPWDPRNWLSLEVV